MRSARTRGTGTNVGCVGRLGPFEWGEELRYNREVDGKAWIILFCGSHAR